MGLAKQNEFVNGGEMAVEMIEFPKNKNLGINEAAAYIGLSPRTLRNKIFNGDGPRHTKRFGRLYFLIADLDAYLANESQVREAYGR